PHRDLGVVFVAHTSLSHWARSGIGRAFAFCRGPNPERSEQDAVESSHLLFVEWKLRSFLRLWVWMLPRKPTRAAELDLDVDSPWFGVSERPTDDRDKRLLLVGEKLLDPVTGADENLPEFGERAVSSKDEDSSAVPEDRRLRDLI